MSQKPARWLVAAVQAIIGWEWLMPGGTYDLTFYAWAAPGSVYPFHCHILTHLMNPGQSGDEMGGLVTLVEYAK